MVLHKCKTILSEYIADLQVLNMNTQKAIRYNEIGSLIDRCLSKETNPGMMLWYHLLYASELMDSQVGKSDIGSSKTGTTQWNTVWCVLKKDRRFQFLKTA